MTRKLNGNMPIKVKKKTRGEHNAILTVLCVIFFVYAVTLIFPFVWLAFNSLKNKIEFSANPWGFPIDAIGSVATNYGKIFTEFNLGAMFFNSAILSIFMPLINLFFCACTAYAYAIHDFKGKQVLYWVAMIPMLVNITGTLPAQYNLFVKIGIYDNMAGILLTATSGFGFAFLLFGSVFQNTSRTYHEADEIDGAGNWRIFLQIYLPQLSAVFGAQWLLGFIGIWNYYMTPYLYLPSHQTLSVGIYNISSQVSLGFSEFSGDYPKLFAAMLISVMPVVILFAAFQEKIMNFSMGGGIKG